MFNSVMGRQEWQGNNRTLSDLGTTVSNEGEVSELCRSLFDFTEPTHYSSNLLDVKDPGQIHAKYRLDLDLRKIHLAIRAKIIYNLQKVISYQEELKNLNILMSNPSIPPIDVAFAYGKTAKINSELAQMDKRCYWKEYCRKVIPILNRYVILMSREYKGQFSAGCDISIDESKINKRISLIEAYLNVVRSLNLIKITVIRDKRIGSLCPGCSRPLNEDGISSDTAKYNCQCGFVEDSINHISEYNDVNKIVPQITSTTINIPAWKEWIDCWLCRSTKTYPQAAFFANFDHLCNTNGYPHRYYVLQGMLPQPPLQIIISLLQSTEGGSDYYNLKNTIRHEFYGWPKPTMTQEQEKEAERLYIAIQTLYPKYKKRKTNINIEILGYTILRIVGLDVKIEDFKIPASEETISYSNEMFQLIFPELNINFEKYCLRI